MYCLLLIGMQGAAFAEELRLVADKTPRASIILPAEPSRAAQLAGYELQHHIQLITGATLPIIPEGDKYVGAPIYIGDTKAARSAGYSPESFAEQEYLVKVGDKAIFLVGRDDADKGKVVYDPKNEVYRGLPGWWTAQGTLYATYDFLETLLGVRWLEATQFGTYFPKSSRLSVPVDTIRRKPSFQYRDAMAAVGDNPIAYDKLVGYWRKAPEQLEKWREVAHSDLRALHPGQPQYEEALGARARLHLLRLRTGGKIERANHSLYGYYKRFWDDPATRRGEFFAKGYDAQGKPPQLCYTNRALIEQVASDAGKYYDTGKANGIFWNPAPPNLFPIVPNDNGSFCKCKECMKFLTEEDRKKQGSAKGQFFSSNSYSNYIFNFVNEVAKELKKTHPDKGVVTLAYSSYAARPDFEVDPSVAIQFCMPANRDDRPKGSRKHEMDLLRQWVNDGSNREITMWLYNTFPMEIAQNQGLHCWPAVFSHELAHQMREFKKLGVKGFFHCGLAQDVDQYLTMQYMFNSDQDVDRLTNEYYTGLYGAAAPPIKEFYKIVEDRYTTLGSGLNESEEEPYNEKVVSKLGELVSQAKTLAVTDNEKGNLALFERGIWTYIQEGMAKRKLITESKIPSISVPKVAPAHGEVSKVDWANASAIKQWHRNNSLEVSDDHLSARIAHDGEYLYLELVDQGDTSALHSESGVFPFDTWEVFISKRRGLPFRQYALNPEGAKVGLSHGEINFRMNVPMDQVPMTVVSDVSKGDQWVARAAWRLDNIVEGGVSPEAPFYLNIARVMANGDIALWGPLSRLRDMKRAPELKLK